MEKKQIINWIIFFVLNYLIFIGLAIMDTGVSIKYSGVCQGNLGIYLDKFDPSKDTIFWWVVWNLFIYAGAAFIQALTVTVTIVIMKLFGRSKSIEEFISWDLGVSKTKRHFMQSFPLIIALYLFVSPEIFRNTTLYLFCFN